MKLFVAMGMSFCVLTGVCKENICELFNGKDLTGWYTYLQNRGKNNDPKRVFSVTNGVIRVSGEEWGALVTEADFSDYRLDVEYRFTGMRFGDKANKALDSGILFHSTGPDGGFGGIWLYSHEYNLITGASGDIWTVGDAKARPDMVVEGETGGTLTDTSIPEGPYRTHAIWKEGGRKIELRGNRRLCRCDIAPDWTDTPAAPYAANERPTGEWNTATLVCRGASVECWFNGRLVNKATRVVPSRGKIQLQSEGCGVEFRRVTLTTLSQVKRTLANGEIWPDDKGVHINAHGGCVLAYGGRYWLYGEHKVAGKAGNRAHGTAVHVYSSDDLVCWRDEGAALVCSRDPNSDIRDNAVIERPKVLFCARTGKFVMRFHLERGDTGYAFACTGVAVSDAPQGPFRYLHGSRANAGCWPQNGDPAKCNRTYFEACMRPEVLKYNLSGGPNEFSRERDLYIRDYDGGQMTRDMTLFVDDDGVAYQISASEENSTLQIAELTDDYQNFTGRFWRMAEKEWTEAPAVCKRGDTYYLIGSGCTGWAPNTARLYRAKQLTGPWERLGNPCLGTNSVTGLGADLTWGGQSNFILKVPDRDIYIAMFDIWHPENAIDGRYVWLPIDFSGETPVVRWQKRFWGIGRIEGGD